MDLATARWQKSTYRGANGCVEVAFVRDRVAVRDSKDPGGPVLRFTTGEWERSWPEPGTASSTWAGHPPSRRRPAGGRSASAWA